MAQRGRHVRGDLLDAARMVAAGLGSAGWAAGRYAAWHLHLLGEQLLWRGIGGNRRSARPGSAAQNQAAPARAGMPCSWAWVWPFWPTPGLTRACSSAFRSAIAALVWMLGKKRPPWRTIDSTNCPAHGPASGGHGGGHGLLFLESHGQPLSHSLPGQSRHLHRCAVFSLAAS